MVAKDSSQVFSDSYREARERFLRAAPTANSYRAGGLGPDGELLYTDVHYLGEARAPNLLVLVSGTHGVEGYPGSAAQLSAQRSRMFHDLPSSTAVLMIHALNPYGFAWDRRVTLEGCDLNRNFVDFARPLPSNPGYVELAEYLVPALNDESALARANDALDEYIRKNGLAAYQTARSSGQYSHPRGMFYGGSAPTHSRQTLERIACEFDVSSRQKVIIIDYHTGLGPYGYGELQCEQPSGLPGYERALEIFGPSATSPDLGTSSSIALTGTQDEFWERILAGRHTYVCLEFGTYAQHVAYQVLRDDHALFAYAPEDANAERGKRVRAAAKAFFYPQRSDWMEMVLHRAELVHRQAIEALRNTRQ